MFDAFRRFRNEWRTMQAFNALPDIRRRVVFYSESSAYWVHLEPLINSLWREYRQDVVYLTSDANEPVFSRTPEGVTPMYIGEGTVRTLLFANLRAGVLVTTMPDLQTFHIKRSPHGVHYAYVYHSMASTHMVYRTEAFDHYDTVFCTGPHQVKEIRAREKLKGLKPKNLVEHGYARVEALMAKVDEGRLAGRGRNGVPTVLVAPSWGRNALLERHGGDFIRPLLDAGFRVILRPHPQTRRFCSALLDSIVSRYEGDQGFVFEENVGSTRSLLEADVMISDWSSAALEFALALEKPVVFVDVPRKVNNPEWRELAIEPLEARLRDQIGVVLAENKLATIGAAVQRLLDGGWSRAKQVRELRSQWVYNLGHSGRAGARALMDIVSGEKVAR